MKQKKKSRKRAGAVLKFLIIIILLVTALAFIAFSPLFNIKSIVVKGCSRYKSEDIAAMSGIVTGQNAFRYMAGSPSNILRMRFGNAEKTISEKCPYIKTIKARLASPDTVEIDIAERQPTAVVPYMGTGLVIDEEGNVLQMASDEGVQKLLTVKGLEFDRYQLGKPLPLKDMSALKMAFTLAEAIKKADKSKQDKLYSKLGWIDVGDRSKILILLDNRITVNLGDISDISDLNYKLDAIRLIFNSNIKKQDEGTLDFTAGENPVFKPN
jgi:cell division protein FtsQ